MPERDHSAESGESHALPLPKTHDYRYPFLGLTGRQGLCRIRIFQGSGRTPVVVASELVENPDTSITNVVEYLVPEIIARHFPHRFEEEDPVLWLEHYPGREDHRRQVRGKPDFDRVVFASWAPRIEYLRGLKRVRLIEPDWRPMPVHEVAALIGELEVWG